MRRAVLFAVVATAAGCGGDDEPDRSAPSRPPAERPAAPAPAVPDGGTERGHGADDPEPRERGSIVVPDADRTPPEPVVRLAGAEADGDAAPGGRVTVSRDEPFVVTASGHDRDGGMGRARVAIRATLHCRDPATGRLRREPFVGYVPPPQIARVRIVPGTTIRTLLVQRAGQRFDQAACSGGHVERFIGEAWADTTNASGLDATSRHIHFRSE